MDAERLQKQVTDLLTVKGLTVNTEPLTEFIREDRNGHPALFPPDSLPKGELWFGAGCLDDDAEVVAVADDAGLLLGLATVTETGTEIWLQQTGQWRQVERV